MKALLIRPYGKQDEREVIDLWLKCNLVVPANNPREDIARKLKINPEYFLVAVLNKKVVATCMAGYEGHRGWINYLAVSPEHRRRGIARKIVQHTENMLKSAGCPKINIQIRRSNQDVINFYERIGFSDDQVMGMGKRLEPDPPFDG